MGRRHLWQPAAVRQFVRCARLLALPVDQTQDRKTAPRAFGEATYEFLPTWFFTFGGRIDYLREQIVEDNAEGIAGFPLVSVTNEADFDELNFVPKARSVEEARRQSHDGLLPIAKAFAPAAST